MWIPLGAEHGGNQVEVVTVGRTIMVHIRDARMPTVGTSVFVSSLESEKL